MLESQVEARLKALESYGFECLKLRTPGYRGTKDRLILWPKWSPAPPTFVEIKRPNQHERSLQAAVRDDWRARGCDVRDMCDTIEKVRDLCDTLLIEARNRVSGNPVPQHIQQAYLSAKLRRLPFTSQFKGSA